jgi:predicted permease
MPKVSLSFLDNLQQDLRHGARMLRLNLGFTTVAVFSLALGIGANTAIFQLVNSVRIRTLPVKNPQELVKFQIGNRTSASGAFYSQYSALTNPMWEAIRDRQKVFSHAAVWNPDWLNLATGGEARYAHIMSVSGDFFETLGVPAILGRVFVDADDHRGCGSPGVVISYGFWQREFGGGSSAIGKKITLEGHPFEVLGVTPASFFGVEVGRNYDVAVPLCADAVLRGENTRLDVRRAWWLAGIARLKPGVNVAQASAQLDSISPQLFQDTVPPNTGPENLKSYLSYRLAASAGATGYSALRREYESPLWLLLAIAGMVLLIACANLANLMLARASARTKEIAVRLAMGASRGRLIRQMLAESLLLAVMGAAGGVLLARWLSGALVALLSNERDKLFFDLEPDFLVLGFTAALAILTCVLFGLAPALRATRTEPGAVMKSTSRGLTAGRERFGLRRGLVVTQIALSLVLMVGALLFTRSLRNLLTLDAGFQQDGVLISNVNWSRLNTPVERRLLFKRELLERVRAIPGVETAASTGIVPVGGSSWNQQAVVQKEGKWTPQGNVYLNRVSPGYFNTLGAPILVGRDFDAHDNLSAPKVAIVNEIFARKYLGTTNAVGMQFRLDVGPGQPDPIFQIVAVTRNFKYNDLREDVSPQAFFPGDQEEKPGLDDDQLIRSGLPLAALTSAVKRTVADVSPDISITFRSFRAEIVNGLARERLMAVLSGFFGLLAALLATIGLYGVISYMVARRRNEIGIRIALGASRGNVVGMVLREAGLLLGAGLIAGIGLSLALAATAQTMLFGLKPRDPVTLTAAVTLLAVVAVAASYLPARRAAGLDPMVALREE